MVDVTARLTAWRPLSHAWSTAPRTKAGAVVGRSKSPRRARAPPRPSAK